MDTFFFKRHVASLVKSTHHKTLAFSNFESDYENIDCMVSYFLKEKFTTEQENIFSFDFRSSDFQTNFDDYTEEVKKKSNKGIYLFCFISKAKSTDKRKLYKLLITFSKKEYVRKLIIIDFVDEVKKVIDKLPEVTPIALDRKILHGIYSS